jgi:methyl-accepting chemotaxis protein
MTLKAKFLIPTLILTLLGLGGTTYVTSQRSTSSLMSVAQQQAKTDLNSLLSLIEVWIDGAQDQIVTFSKLKAVSKALAPGADASQELADVMPLFQEALQRNKSLNSLYLINAQGVVIAATTKNLMNADLKTRDYFQQAITGRHVISNPVFSVASGLPVFVIASPVISGDKIIGVIASGVKTDLFTQQFILPMSTPKGYALIAAADGLVLSHPDAQYIGKLNLAKDTDYGAKMLAQSSGVLDVISLGTPKLILFDKSKITGWIVILAINKEAAFADAKALGQLIIILSGALILVLLAGSWLLLSINVLKPVNALVASAGEIAAGRLDAKLDVDRNDEIGVLQRAFAKMVENLKIKITEAEEKGALALQETEKARLATDEALAARVKAESAKQEGMLQAAGQLEGIVEVVTSASEELSAQIDHSRQGADEQSQRMTETATAMEEMNATVLEVAKNASQAAETADDAKHKAQDGASIVSRVIKSIGEVQTQSIGLKTDMAALGQQAEGIGRVMNVISDIADQTNLLALNAAIEAARAGDAGRGFAVVADEVRKLAEKTMTATKEVGDAIRDIQQGAKKNVDNVELSVSKIDGATELATRSGDALQEIVRLVDLTTDQVRAIAAASQEQSSASDEINRSIEDVNRISAQTSDAMHQSAQAVTELANQSLVLKRLIEEMKADSSAHPGQSGKTPPRC